MKQVLQQNQVKEYIVKYYFKQERELFFKRGIDVPDGYSVPSWNKLKYATIYDKDYYDRINKVDE